jgi:hypothetical protein
MERNGKGKAERKRALLNRANTATTDVRTWSEYFTEKKKAVVSTVVTTGVSGVKHAALHTFAKVAVFTVGFAAGGYLAAIGGAIATLVGGEFFWGLLGKSAQDALTDYGAGVIDDWVKFGGETVSGVVYDRVTGPSSPSTTGLKSTTGSVTIQDEMATLCASVGVLAALMSKSEELRAAPVAYCDDAYAQARLIKRIEDEMGHVKTHVDALKVKLDSLKSFVDGDVSSDVRTRKVQIDTVVEAVVKANGAPHFIDTYMSYLSNPNPLYRLSHCSKLNCFGPGHTGLD